MSDFLFTRDSGLPYVSADQPEHQPTPETQDFTYSSPRFELFTDSDASPLVPFTSKPDATFPSQLGPPYGQYGSFEQPRTTYGSYYGDGLTPPHPRILFRVPWDAVPALQLPPQLPPDYVFQVPQQCEVGKLDITPEPQQYSKTLANGHYVPQSPYFGQQHTFNASPYRLQYQRSDVQIGTYQRRKDSTFAHPPTFSTHISQVHPETPIYSDLPVFPLAHPPPRLSFPVSDTEVWKGVRGSPGLAPEIIASVETSGAMGLAEQAQGDSQVPGSSPGAGDGQNVEHIKEARTLGLLVEVEEMPTTVSGPISRYETPVDLSASAGVVSSPRDSEPNFDGHDQVDSDDQELARSLTTQRQWWKNPGEQQDESCEGQFAISEPQSPVTGTASAPTQTNASHVPPAVADALEPFFGIRRSSRRKPVADRYQDDSGPEAHSDGSDDEVRVDDEDGDEYKESEDADEGHGHSETLERQPESPCPHLDDVLVDQNDILMEHLFTRRPRRGHLLNHLEKVFHMVGSGQYTKYITWDKDGTSLIIPDEAEFAKHVMPTYFGSEQWTSFSRQMTTYKFSRRLVVVPGKAKKRKHILSHPRMRKDDENLWKLVQMLPEPVPQETSEQALSLLKKAQSVPGLRYRKSTMPLKIQIRAATESIPTPALSSARSTLPASPPPMTPADFVDEPAGLYGTRSWAKRKAKGEEAKQPKRIRSEPSLKRTTTGGRGKAADLRPPRPRC